MTPPIEAVQSSDPVFISDSYSYSAIGGTRAPNRLGCCFEYEKRALRGYLPFSRHILTLASQSRVLSRRVNSNRFLQANWSMNHHARSATTLHGVAVSLALIGLAAILWIRFDSPIIALVLAIISVLHGTVYGLSPTSRPWLVRAFEHLTFPVRWLTTWLVLALVYYGVIFPISIWFRTTGRSISHRDRAGRSAWHPIECTDNSDSYFQTF